MNNCKLKVVTSQRGERMASECLPFISAHSIIHNAKLWLVTLLGNKRMVAESV